MDVIRIDANLLKLDLIPLFNFSTDGVEALLAVRLAKNSFTILHRCNKVVVKIGYIVVRSPDRSHPSTLLVETLRGKTAENNQVRILTLICLPAVALSEVEGRRLDIWIS